MNNDTDQSILIDVKNLSKIYTQGGNKITAVDNISFQLKKGQSLAILGPSGSGKTTLLELLAGLTTPTTGTTIINGVDVHKGSDTDISKFRNQTIGFVFQLMHLQDYLTAQENVELPALANSSKGSNRALELLKMVGLSDRINQYPNQLSGGEMQRVAIARALINNPDIILADEPTAKLDKDNSDKVLNILDEIQKTGVSVIMITHDPEVANRFTNKIQLTNGKIKLINIAN
jgi:putative ABC transport system ATP-binding protein